MGHILFTALVGAVSGFIAWLLAEPLMPANFMDPRAQFASLMLILLLGGFVAGSIGAVTGMRQGSRRHLLMGLFVGGFAGACAGSIGGSVGGNLANLLFPGFNIGFKATTIPGFVTMIAPMGALIGLAIGLPMRSAKQAVLGLIGGTLGGITAGIAFSPLSHALAGLTLAAQGGDEIGKPGRAAMAVVLGGAIGLFVSLAREVAKTAWVSQHLGRNEGREWVVDAPQTFIGRDERAHIPLFGDANVAPMHACIVRQGPGYTIFDGGTPLGLIVDGQRVQQAPLNHGSIIQVGQHTLEFQLKGGKAPVRPPDQARQVAPVQQIITPPAVAPAPAATPSRLTVLNGPTAGHSVPLVGSIEIGREAQGIRLDQDRNASRRHARIDVDATGLRITDLGSTNGTLVNDQPVTQSPLKLGDRIRIGNTELRID